MKIEMIHQEKERKLTEFWFKLSETATHLHVTIKANHQFDEIISDSDSIYVGHKWYLLAGYENIEERNWRFTIEGIKVNDKKTFRRIIKYSLN